MSAIRLHIENFRNIKSCDWTIEGLCVLTGPNNSGKTNICTALKFMGNCFFDPFQEICWKFELEDPIGSTVLQLEYQNVAWTIKFNQTKVHESLSVDGVMVLDHTAPVEEMRCRARTTTPKPFFNLCAWLLAIDSVTYGTEDQAAQMKIQKRYDELFSNTRLCTDSFDHSNGVRRIVSYLSVIEESRAGDLVIFDDFEQHLSPRAIQILIPFLRKHAEEHDCNIILTTHSPTVLNEFKKNLEDVYILGQESTLHPIKLTEKFDRDWLVHFSLGDLLDRGILY